ncbi:cyanoglobin [Marivita sp. XM-24bin2]|jgi:hemoglobin|uniref:globin domain-containing protein n=1 Tax=unclassified Marivita TaxID=2632480 RepID=UPI000D7ABDEF|nr:cyanoglobin [Marivita sp. XM-24bin2]MCR9107445.1 cyanoglobin [Paracoccaceae bacterium]PWL35788.1 MAG: cyanoglobin [Marivita sp. XM-24bin2]
MKTALSEIGGEDRLHDLITSFYDRMETDPSVRALHRLHFRGHGLNHTRQTQFEFMCGFLGGRAYYRERFGHMNLREIHAHIPIRAEDADLWLQTFDAALVDCEMFGPAVEKLRATLRRAAHMLVNDVPDWRVEADEVASEQV